MAGNPAEDKRAGQEENLIIAQGNKIL